MSRYKIIIEYDGSPYVGWQKQDGHVSVQSVIERAIKAFSQEEVVLTVAGRTDAGVHACGQVAHFDLQKKQWPAKQVGDAINAHLRLAQEAVAILSVEEVDADFNARFSAIKRHYVYHLLNRRAQSVLEQKRVWWLPYALDVAAMQEATQILLGAHDFSTFRSAHCQAKNPYRTLDQFDIIVQGEKILFYVSARAFLHHQVRSMVGSLVEVGRGHWSKQDLQHALQAADRRYCGMVAPSCGLYLQQVDYPEKEGSVF